MRLGVVILPEHRWPVARELWRRAEELGFDSGWTHDHLMWRSLRDSPWYGCLPTLVAAAAVTSRLTLGPLVATPSFRHPVTLAKELMTLDEVSGGRLVCGLGAGAGGFDEAVLGQPPAGPAGRAARFEEFVELTDLLLRQRDTDYAGRYYTARGARMHPGCVQRPRAPFAIAAAGPRGMRTAARYATTWLTNGVPGRFDPAPYGAALPLLRGQLARLDQACAEVGRDPATLGRMLVTGSTVGGVLESVGSYQDAVGRLAEAGFTDLVLPWPRPSDPYAGRLAVLEAVAGTRRPQPLTPVPPSWSCTT
jgi:alkanesulfonate monooxygenase SsuD/methylene tetrahydromethanopterin reductase-like flavin-dependent oxidoreductase (luciferase family)